MCGIICYFGGSGNGLTRLLTAMSAIIYRAPDSTGVGLFGDEQEPVRLRKAVGSVSQMSRALLGAAAYPNQSAKLMKLWTLPEKPVSLAQHQQRLLKFQEHPFIAYDSETAGGLPPTIDELTELEGEAAFLKPGMPGRAEPLPVFYLKSEEDVRHLIHQAAAQYDISTAVIRSLLHCVLETQVRESKESEEKITEILNIFDRIFDEILSRDESIQDVPAAESLHEQNPFPEAPEIRELVWQYLKKIPVQIPDDYDRDGVRGTFRILDAALMSRLRLHPEIHTQIQNVLESMWPPAKEHPNTDWQTFYQAEKGVNVYGWGAASVLAYLQKTEVFPLLWQASVKTADPVPAFREGRTDPACLRFLAEPVIAHGRWALQSAVTRENAHPFHDALRHRCIVLNGQFSSSVETETRDFLEQVAGTPFRTENSSEYFSLLWGYYFGNLSAEKRRYDEIRLQIDTGLDDYHMGSHSIDFKVYRQIQGKTDEQLDELAFLEAVRRMKSDGGQIAVAGISLHSPRRLYVACHNRPAFVVQRADNNDIMIVSDINAALGLFSQSMIHENTDRLKRLIQHHKAELQNCKNSGADDAEIAKMIRAQAQAENSLLEPFRVTVSPLEGEEIFVRLAPAFRQGRLTRCARIFDFDGKPLPDIEAFSTVLNPLQISKELYSSFYETHLRQVPGAFRNILNTYDSEKGASVFPDLHKRVMKRRFGPGFIGLKRILLVGMGSSYNMGLMAKPVFQKLLPALDVRAVQPTEIDAVQNWIFPESDLVLMLSWSSTTADMVEFAKELLSVNAVMIGVTEKVFADMALICSRSGGIISVQSGEEVTVSGIKSTLCMLLCLHLFIGWLGEKMKHLKVRELGAQLKAAPSVLSALLDDRQIKKYAAALAEKNRSSHACILLGNSVSFPVCSEAALKLEECTWSSIGRAMDYQDLLREPAFAEKLAGDPRGHLVVVDAAGSSRMPEALDVMRTLWAKKIPFGAIAADRHPHENEIRKFSSGSCLFLPRTDDAVRPFISILFYYLFTLEFARARGRKDDEFPRNRAKSVTAGRSRPAVRRSSGGELMALERLNSILRNAETGFPHSTESLWERRAVSKEQRRKYRRIRLIGEYLGKPNPLQYFFPHNGNQREEYPEKSISVLGNHIFKDLKEGGELIFLPFDSESESAARNMACQWQRFLDCPVYVRHPYDPNTLFHDEALLFCLAVRPPGFDKKTVMIEKKQPVFWLCPSFFNDAACLIRSSDRVFTTTAQSAIELYADLSILFTEAWKSHSRQKGCAAADHLRHSGIYIDTLLNDGRLHRQIRKIMNANRNYHTAFYIGPPAGTGQAWVRRFDRIRRLETAFHPFGACAHGPLASIDNRAAAKYIRLTGRKEMKSEYGEENVMQWEQRFLDGISVDRFLKEHPESENQFRAKPFYAEGDWFIPVLRHDYDTAEDNLVILDAARSHYFGQALDELSTLGCRNARIILVTQDAFAGMPNKRALFKHPYSHLIRIPSPAANGESVVITGFILPFLMDIIGMEMAANAGGVQEDVQRG